MRDAKAVATSKLNEKHLNLQHKKMNRIIHAMHKSGIQGVDHPLYNKSQYFTKETNILKDKIRN